MGFVLSVTNATYHLNHLHWTRPCLTLWSRRSTFFHFRPSTAYYIQCWHTFTPSDCPQVRGLPCERSLVGVTWKFYSSTIVLHMLKKFKFFIDVAATSNGHSNIPTATTVIASDAAATTATGTTESSAYSRASRIAG